jgi:1-deoxy-D-xylulose-5-phosphate reductoisomerase
MVEFVDGSVLAQLGISDMRMPIQFALTYPERCGNDLPSVNLSRIGKLEFSEPDLKKFPCLELAQEALRTGGSMTAVLNAANEVAVEKFLTQRIRFSGIPRLVETTMAKHNVVSEPSLEDVLDADRWARRVTEEAAV